MLATYTNGSGPASYHIFVNTSSGSKFILCDMKTKKYVGKKVVLFIMSGDKGKDGYQTSV